MDKPDVSIVMPCRNEENAVGFCVEDARTWLAQSRHTGEILVVDNGSTDNSARIAEQHGARVIAESNPGYGFALRRGIAESRGKIIIMGDSDTTYDFLHLDSFCTPLLAGEYDIIIGDRFAGGIEKGAMPRSHIWGVRMLSFLAGKRFHTDVRDFHCGLRGLTAEAAKQLPFQSGGMEFATEMIALAAQQGLRIGQTPTPLRRCHQNRRSKLRTLPDGFRHLRYILTFQTHGGKQS